MNNPQTTEIVSKICMLLDKMDLYEKDVQMKKSWIQSQILNDSVEVPNMTKEEKVNKLTEADLKCDQILEFVNNQRSELKTKLSDLGYNNLIEVSEIVRKFNFQ